MGLMQWLLKVQANAMAKKGIKIEDPKERLEETDKDLREKELEKELVV